MRWLDTNILIRYLTNDDPAKAQAGYALLKRVERGEEELQTSETVIAEVAYVLSSRAQYRLPHDEIRALLVPIINLRSLRLPHKRTFLRALEVYAEQPSFDFEDALSVAYMESSGITELYSYDTDFDRIGGISRLEP